MTFTLEAEYNKYIKASTSTGLVCYSEYLGNGKWRFSSYDPDVDEAEVVDELSCSYKYLISTILEFFGVD